LSLSRWLIGILPTLPDFGSLFKGSTSPLSEAERSHNDIAKLVRRALRVKLAAQSETGDIPYVDAVEFYPSFFIYMVRGLYFSAPYSISDSGEVTIGNSVEVMPVVTYEPVKRVPPLTSPMQEGEINGDCVDLLTELQEASAEICIATPGWGTSGYYSAEVLRRDGPAIFPAGTQMFWNHQTEAEMEERPEGDLRNLAAVTTEPAVWKNGPQGLGLYTRSKIRETYAQDIKELKDDIGVSMRAFGKYTVGKAEGREGRIVESLVKGKSIDFVTRAGRGGKVLELFESAGRKPVPANTTTAADSRIQENTSMAMTEDEIRLLKEAQTAATTASATVERLQAQMNTLTARTLISEAAAAYTMPPAARTRVINELSINPPIKDGQIDVTALQEAVKAKVTAELNYLAEATGSPVRSMGATAPPAEEPVNLEEVEKDLTATLAALRG